MKKLLVFTALIALFGTLCAAAVKVDIDGRAQRIKFKVTDRVNCRGVFASWAKELKQSYLCIDSNVGKEWKRYSLTFTPDKDGTVTLSVRGSHKKPPAADWIAYDDFKVSGAVLKNGSFEEVRNGAPAFWSTGRYGYLSGNAAHGKRYVASSHNNFLRQNIEVRKDVPVKVEFSARFDRSTAGQFHPQAPVKSRSSAVGGKLKRDLAKAARIRIEIDSRQFQSAIVSAKAGRGLKIAPDKNYGSSSKSYYTVTGTADLTNNWQEFEFSFALNRATNTKIILRSMPVAGDERWVAYDDFQVTGVKFRNGDFASAGSNGFSFWVSNAYNLAVNRKDAAKGRNYAFASYEHSMMQHIYPWNLVTVKFKAKNGGSGKAGSPYAIIFDKPASYYRLYNKQAKYLPLSDKGLYGKDIANTHTEVKNAPKVYPEFAVPASAKAAAADELRMPFELIEENGVARVANIRFGMPLPEKMFYDVDSFKLLDPAGAAVEAQYSAIAFWPDRSIKSVLVQFDAALAKNSRSTWVLTGGKRVKPVKSVSPFKVEQSGSKVKISTGKLVATLDKNSFNLLSDIIVDGKKCGSFDPKGLILTDEKGKALPMSGAKISRFAVEEKGTKRLVLRVDGKFFAPDKKPVADYVVRLGFYANSAKVDMTISFYNASMSREFYDFTSLVLPFIPAQDPPVNVVMEKMQGKRIFQHHDMALQVDDRNFKGKKYRLAGGGRVGFASGKSITFSIKDLWRRYPKAVSVSGNRINFELLPQQPGKKFGTDLPWYLQFPFCEGKYRMKWGMGFTEDLTIDFAGAEEPAGLAALQVVPVIDRDYLHSTRVFEGVVPKAVKVFDAWDNAMIQAFHGINRVRERQREYGFLNYGDNYGERGRNWNNNEYDTANGLFLLFLRTGNTNAARWAFAAARHQADVDIVHAYPDRYYLGCNAQHGIGHTGVSYQPVNPATWTWKYDYAYIGTNGHTWSEGMLHSWMFTGDAVVMDSALLLGQHLLEYTAPGFVRLGSHERSAGWSVRAILGYYRATGEKKYRDAAWHIVQKALAEQRFDKGGAWPHVLPGDHSGGHKDAYGNCPYLMGILSEMMRKYYQVDPRPEVKKSLISVASWLQRTYNKEYVGWPYGASWDAKPYHKPNTGCNMLILPGLLAGGRFAGNKEFYNTGKDVVNLAILNGSGGNPKSFAMQVCFVGGIIDEMLAFGSEVPKAQSYSGDIGPFILKFCKIRSEFKSRAPEKKEFEIILKKDSAAIELVRRRYGARPQGKKEFSVELLKGGKSIRKDIASVTQNKRYSFALKGKAGERFTIRIYDDMSGIWNIPPTPDADIFSRLFRGYFCGNGGMTTRYLTVPAGVSEFTVYYQSIHTGVASVYLLDEGGKTLGFDSAGNYGNHRFPWLPKNTHVGGKKEFKVKVRKLDRPQNVILIGVSGGDLGLEVQGIPPYVSTVPAFYR